MELTIASDVSQVNIDKFNEQIARYIREGIDDVRRISDCYIELGDQQANYSVGVGCCEVTEPEVKPFIVVDGQVYVNQSFIKNATIQI